MQDRYEYLGVPKNRCIVNDIPCRHARRARGRALRIGRACALPRSPPQIGCLSNGAAMMHKVRILHADGRHEPLSLRSRFLDVRDERRPAPCGQGLSQRQADDSERHRRHAHLLKGVDFRARVRRRGRRGAATDRRWAGQPGGDWRLAGNGAPRVGQPIMTAGSASQQQLSLTAKNTQPPFVVEP